MSPILATPAPVEFEHRRTPLHGRDLLSLRDLAPDDVLALLILADGMKKDPVKFSTALRAKTLAMVFEKPSLRTRVSFDVGMVQLGGHALDLSPEISLGRRESLYDVAKNLERMVDAIMVRTYAHEGLVKLAEYASIPVINGLTDFSHPCQGLADYMTMRERRHELRGLRVAYVGDGNNVCHSLMFGAALVGAHLVVGTPAGYEPAPEALAWAREQGMTTGGRVDVTNQPDDAVRGADVVYTDVWASMGQEAHAAERHAIFMPFQVNARLFALAKPDAIFMHCLPAHRGSEVTDEVIDSPNSVVFQQAENRLHAQKALLFSLIR